MRAILLLLFLSFSFGITAQQKAQLSGVVTDSKGEALPYVSVIIESNNESAVTDQNGFYKLITTEGKHKVLFSYLGYELIEENISISSSGTVFNLRMIKTAVDLDAAEIVADSRDRAREIMKEVRNRRKGYLNSLQRFKADSYQFTQLEQKRVKSNATDSLNDSLHDPLNLYYSRDMILEVTEMVSTVYFENPRKYKEVISGVKKSDELFKRDAEGESITIGGSFEYGESTITPEFSGEINPWILIEGAEVLELNLYKSLIDFKALTDKPILSPLAATSAVAYKFDYKGTDLINGEKVYLISLTPLNSLENLFRGNIWFSAENYSIVKYDLDLEGGNLLFAKTLKVKAEYEMLEENVSVLQNSDISYLIRDGAADILGTVKTEFSNYDVNGDFSEVNFDREIKKYDIAAFDQDSTFWDAKRKLDLDSSSLKFIAKSIEISEYHQSPEYLAKLDSAFNKINIWTPLMGYGRRNRIKGREFYVEGILGQINPFGIGGYRHKLPGYFQQEFKNDFKLRTEGFIDYGFGNDDIKGRLSVGFTYNPRKFVSTKVTIGDYYSMVNNFASLEQTFSRSNYIRTKVLGVEQRMEIINGLYASASFQYQDQQPLDNLEFSEWSEELFGELNTPIDFKRYTKSEFNLHLVYRIRQKFYIKRNKKVVIPSKFPELALRYRKGIKGLFNSEVDFDYLELSASQEIEVGRFGSTRWQARIGSFINQKDLRVLEYKFFRGSDDIVFSDPLQSFQLLGPTLSTPNEYIRGNVIHHFEGTILNKVPLVRRLKMGLAVGGGTINIPDAGFYHGEVFAGLEKSLRIKKELFRLGVYAVTADNTVENPNLTWKFGLTFYEPFTRKWGY